MPTRTTLPHPAALSGIYYTTPPPRAAYTPFLSPQGGRGRGGGRVGGVVRRITQSGSSWRWGHLGGITEYPMHCSAPHFMHNLCVCVCVTPNPFQNPKAFAIIHHLSTAMSALQQCLVVHLPRPFLPLGTTHEDYIQSFCAPYRTLQPQPHLPAPRPAQGPRGRRDCHGTWRWSDRHGA